MDNSEKNISSVSDYIEVVVKSFYKRKPNDFYEKERVFFRGQSRDYPLIPSIARPIRNGLSDTFMRFEKDMIDTAKLQEPIEFANVIYPINLLAKMQHYGLPTRLLDITENALVALYFACNKDFKYDGKIYCFKVQKTEINSAYSLYANMAAFFYTQPYSIINVTEFIDIVKYESFYPRADRDIPNEIIVDKISEILNKPLFVLPEMLSEREKRQHAAMIVFPNDISRSVNILESENTPYFTDEISDIKYRNIPEISLTITIDGKQKKKLLRELELLGVSEQFLFPEIEKKCNSIKIHIENIVDEKLEILPNCD